jgi:mono/diheme cytochrome c family protein
MTRVCVAAVVLALLSALPARAAVDRQAADQIARGLYLATVGDCSACHTAPGGKPYAGGRAIETPFGTLVAPNITPDPDTGIGTWTDEQFVAALEQGIGPGGSHLYPAMPYPYFNRTSRDDLVSIRAYLSTLEPVHNSVQANQLPFPFDIRTGMVGWNLLFFSPGKFSPDSQKSAEWNNGAYLVEGLGHCGACHTPKNWLGGDKTSRALEGGLLQGWFSPNITGDVRTGLGHWSADDVVTYLKTGRNAITAAIGPMSEVITDSTSRMTDADLQAIATYLKALPGTSDTAQPVAASDPRMRAGAAIYADNCTACHAASGTGVTGLFSALKGSPTVQASDPTNLVRIVLEGTRSVATERAPTGPAMPTMGWKLSDDQTAAVVTYIRNSWGNAASAVSAKNVTHLRKQAAAPGS